MASNLSINRTYHGKPASCFSALSSLHSLFGSHMKSRHATPHHISTGAEPQQQDVAPSHLLVVRSFLRQA